MKGIGVIVIILIILIQQAHITHSRTCYEETTTKKRRNTSCEKPIYIIKYDWLGAKVVAAVVEIILRERMGYCVKTLDATVEESYPLLMDTKTSYIAPEVWYNTRRRELEPYINENKIFSAGEIGISARAGWYVRSEYLPHVEGLDDYRAYRKEETVKLFSTNATYPNGRFLDGPLSWVTYNKEIIDNLALRLTSVRVNESTAEEELVSLLTKTDFDEHNMKNLVLAWFWEPHEIFVKHKLKRVTLPQYSETCHSNYNLINDMVDCDYPSEKPQKLYSKPLITDHVNAKRLLEAIMLESSDQLQMMGNASFNSLTDFEAACFWLKTNEAKVNAWLPGFVLTDNIWLILLIVFGGALLLVCFFVILFLCGVILFIAYVRRTQAAKLIYAPRNGPMAVLFCEIHQLEELANYSENNTKRVISLFESIVRQLIPMFEGYEVKTPSTSFMIVFSSPEKAIQFAARAHEQALNANWPMHIMHLPYCKSVINQSGELLLRGPRLRIGIGYGYPNCVMDRITQQMDYFGLDVNKAARVEALATGGEILIDHAMSTHVMEFVEHDLRMRLDRLGEYQLQGDDGPYERIYRLHWHPYEEADKVNRVSIKATTRPNLVDNFKQMTNRDRMHAQHQMFEVMTNDDLAKTFSLLKMHMHDAQVDFDQGDEDEEDLPVEPFSEFL